MDVERPSAQQLCERVAVLKEDPQHNESMRAGEVRSVGEQADTRGRNEIGREVRSLRQQVQYLQQIIQSQMNQLDENIQALRQKDENTAAAQQQVCQQEREKNLAIKEKVRLKRQLSHVNPQLKESERAIAQFRDKLLNESK